ncbi:MAG: cation:proton antiporter [Thermodesulfobacteriota bacterium]
MEQIPILTDIVILMVVSVPMSILLTRIGFPTVVGFLLTGVIAGPYGLGLVTDVHEVDTLAEIGIVLLLFTIGLEFSIKKMMSLKREGIVGGGLQVVVTTAIVLAIALGFDLPMPVALLLGFIISLSSTAIVLKLLVDKGEVSSIHGNLIVGVLLFQDIAVVLMVMVIQSIGGGGGGGEAATLRIMKDLAVSLGAFAVIVLGVGFIIPRLFDQVVKLRNREVFILAIVLVCLGTAWMTSLFGLSLALGAFVAGLAISESEYSNQIVAEVIPFRDTFSALFFISIGMLLDFRYFIGHLPMLLLLVFAILALKSIVLMGVGQALRYPFRLCIIVGLSLSQIGEFSFILIKMGHDYGMLGLGLYQALLAASIVTMAITPLSFHFSSRVARAAGRRLGRHVFGAGEKKTPLANHVIIIGYGVNGRNLARVLKATAIEHLVVDISMEMVKEAKKEGHRAYYGDTSHPEIMKKMGVERAKMVVVAISDPISTRRMVKVARDLNRAMTIVVRTRYIREVEELYTLGANQVIPEEFETSVEIFARVLKDYRIPGNIIQNQIDIVRQEGYAMFRSPSIETEGLTRLTEILEASLMDTFYVDAGSPMAGKTLREVDLRNKTGATIIAIVRGGMARTNPAADFVLEPSDVLVVLGSHAELNAANLVLKDACPLPEA